MYTKVTNVHSPLCDRWREPHAYVLNAVNERVPRDTWARPGTQVFEAAFSLWVLTCNAQKEVAGSTAKTSAG